MIKLYYILNFFFIIQYFLCTCRPTCNSHIKVEPALNAVQLFDHSSSAAWIVDKLLSALRQPY